MSLPSRVCAVALLAASLGGCNAISNVIGGGSGVMPESDVGLPPSMRGAVKGADAPKRAATVDDDGEPLPSAPTRQLALPKTIKSDTRSADAGPRRIDREDIEGADTGSRRSSSGGMGPAMTPGGGVGMGGKF